MPDRPDIKKGQTVVQHTLEKAHNAIFNAICNEDGLDGASGAYVLELIVDALGYDPIEECGCGKRLNKCQGH